MILKYLNKFYSNELTEEKKRRKTHKQKLQIELKYAPIEDYLNKREPVARYFKGDIGKIMDEYLENNFMTEEDWITFPKGTIFTWVDSITDNKIYDIYRVSATKYCYIAIPPEETVDLFGEYPYRDGDGR